MSQNQPDQAELRIVLLGGKYSGKTCLTNDLLGLQEAGINTERLANNLVKEGLVAGRKVVLIDTHGWWRNFQLIDTAMLIQQELVLSVRLCPPGPHAFILTVVIDIPFDEDNRRAIEQHMGLFGESIWMHTIVVFTRGESLKGRSIGDHIESEGEALKWLVEKCGNRYCVFDKKQVCELFRKIDGLLETNSHRHFEIDKSVVEDVMNSKKAVAERAQARFMNMMKNREKLKEEVQALSMPEIRILLLGWVSSRKTSAKNIILNQTEKVTKKTTSVQTHSGEVDGMTVSLVDTPGWWKYFPAECTPAWVKAELRRSLNLGSKAPHAILLAVPADTTFLEEQRKITEDNMKMFGEQVWRHTMVLFTCGDLISYVSIEEHIESEGEPLKWLVEKCGNRYHVFDNINRGDGSQVSELLEKIKEMEAQNISPTSFESKNGELQEATDDEEEEEELGVKIGKLLDSEWTRMDQKMEEKIKKLWTSACPVGMGNRSMDFMFDFKGDEPSQKTQDVFDSPERSTLASAFGQAQHQLSCGMQSELLEKMREPLEREFGRRERVVMERAWGMLLQMTSSQDVTSEPDEHEQERARQKVCQWLPPSSGRGSEFEDEDNMDEY